MGAPFAFYGSASAQIDIARWSFTTVIGAPYNTPTPTTDLTTASATQLGMTNSFNGGNTASCDVLNVAPVGGSSQQNPDPLGITAGNNAWRVRGAQTPTGNNGWALAAPQYTQGAEFDVSTVGFSNIVLTFDFFCTTQGIRDLQVQYNAGSGWTNFRGVFGGNVATEHDASLDTELIATGNDWNTRAANVTSNTIDFAANSISGVANNANFGIRLVSAYDPNNSGGTTYSGASGGTYNNTSGNWRFDQVAVRGSAVPEPASLAAIGIGLAALLRRRPKSS